MRQGSREGGVREGCREKVMEIGMGEGMKRGGWGAFGICC